MNLRKLPSVSSLLSAESSRALIQRFGEGAVSWAFKTTIQKVREKILAGNTSISVEKDSILKEAELKLLRVSDPTARHVINGTGIILHTGVGRAPLSDGAVHALSRMNRASLVELDLESGDRGRRDQDLEELLCEITGSESSTVVNNNAAATFLVLHALAAEKEVIVSRGQLIEIGGSYRLPDILEQSGAILKEVGTTNRTHLRDFERAISEQTGAILHVHTSNYKIQGFTTSPDLSELTKLGKDRGVPVIDDLGSGALTVLQDMGLPSSPTVQDGIRAGADLVCYSGDKLIGGPQTGIISGKKKWIDLLRADPFYRVVRVDKLCLAALQATLIDFMSPKTLAQKNGVYFLATRSKDELVCQAQMLTDSLADQKEFKVEIVDTDAYLGGGSLPGEALQSVAVSIASDKPLKDIAHALRIKTPIVLGRINRDRLIFDMRTIFPDEVDALRQAIINAFTQTSSA